MRICIGLLAIVLWTYPARADDRLDRLEKRVDQLEADLKARDEEIARLKQQQATPPPPTGDQIEKTRQDVLKDIESREATTPRKSSRRTMRASPIPRIERSSTETIPVAVPAPYAP